MGVAVPIHAQVGLMLRHATTTSNCSLVVKVDEDLYIHPQRFHQLINRLLPKSHANGSDPPNPNGVYAGKLWTGTQPVRAKGNKFYLPEALYPSPTYPPYTGGPLYIMSSILIDRLPFTVDKVGDELVPSYYAEQPPLFRFEDVFFGDMIGRLPPEHKPSIIDIHALFFLEVREGYPILAPCLCYVRSPPTCSSHACLVESHRRLVE